MIKNSLASAENLEKIRFSITRLKLIANTTETCHSSTWKDKILDYEIETHHVEPCPEISKGLEKIRFSITRLKQYKKARLPTR